MLPASPLDWKRLVLALQLAVRKIVTGLARAQLRLFGSTCSSCFNFKQREYFSFFYDLLLIENSRRCILQIQENSTILNEYLLQYS